MKQPLSRRKLHRICQAYDGGELSALVPARNNGRVVLVKNAGASTLPTGSPLTVVGFASTSASYAQMLRRLSDDSLVVAVKSPTAVGDVVHARAGCPIPPGKIGRATAISLVYHVVTINSSTHTQASQAFASVASDGYYEILAKSATSGSSAVCALSQVVVGSGGGGELSATVANNVLTLEIV